VIAAAVCELGPDDDTQEVEALLMPRQLSPSRVGLDLPQPSVLDVLRQCRPSRELVGLLSRESTRLATEGNTDDAATLLALALCVREVATK
jgi:hypothetical protein